MNRAYLLGGASVVIIATVFAFIHPEKSMSFLLMSLVWLTNMGINYIAGRKVKSTTSLMYTVQSNYFVCMILTLLILK